MQWEHVQVLLLLRHRLMLLQRHLLLHRWKRHALPWGHVLVLVLQQRRLLLLLLRLQRPLLLHRWKRHALVRRSSIVDRPACIRAMQHMVMPLAV